MCQQETQALLWLPQAVIRILTIQDVPMCASRLHGHYCSADLRHYSTGFIEGLLLGVSFRFQLGATGVPVLPISLLTVLRV